jgi:hypothetical protein
MEPDVIVIGEHFKSAADNTKRAVGKDALTDDAEELWHGNSSIHYSRLPSLPPSSFDSPCFFIRLSVIFVFVATHWSCRRGNTLN